tara:strand:- start:149 stop:412 length:264 start_codon:yes stop_codon:yes gene_type:complete
MSKLMKELQRTISPYDPLVIYVNKHHLLGGQENSYSIGIKGSNFGDYVKVLYERDGVPNMYSNFREYCVIQPITKHSIIRPSEPRKR